MGCCLKQRAHFKLVNINDFLILIETEKNELSDFIDNESDKMREWKKELILLIISGMTELSEKIKEKIGEEETGINSNDLVDLFDAYYDLKEKVLIVSKNDDTIYNNDAMRFKMNSVYRDHFFRKLNTFLGYSQEFTSNNDSFISVNK